MLCFPSGIAVWRGLRFLLGEAAGYLVGCRTSAQVCRREGVRNILRDSIGLAILGFIVILLLPILRSFVAVGSFALIFLALIISAGAFFYGAS